MEIKTLESEFAEQYREIRLTALQTNPESFSASYEEERLYPIERFIARLENPHAFTFGALIEDKLVGVVRLVLEQSEKMKHRANIYGMYVLPDYRSNGIGKSLMEQAIEKVKETVYIEQIYLTVVATNVPAKKLYQSLGFAVFGLDKRALRVRDTYFDEELMVLQLKG
ncbi:GNAT family N-acetyltransferase [Robertmurraya yapensis]|uniref:GNAT family N-acetyltransferase n=1 Tax=Bacillus yapensis TaxID=2492960 RepID=A0A431WI09_9BACI|nr:GNAT family N-acetyltransferase [Bacillus yapensis]RTR35163.1 GNAT family N-acetyltransferase [Bacillus yapensis]TKS97672.1 GNAT family N-acetyltransferase [Bacillus yapensis]